MLCGASPMDPLSDSPLASLRTSLKVMPCSCPHASPWCRARALCKAPMLLPPFWAALLGERGPPMTALLYQTTTMILAPWAPTRRALPQQTVVPNALQDPTVRLPPGFLTRAGVCFFEPPPPPLFFFFFPHLSLSLSTHFPPSLPLFIPPPSTKV